MEDQEAKRNLLIVDDTPANIRVLVDILMAKYEISVATNGPEALEIIWSEEPPDLVLLDIFMPDMDGYEVCRAIKKDERSKEIPVVFVTANTDDETLTQAFDAGGIDYVRKPVKRMELLARIKSVLDNQELMKKAILEEKLKGILEIAGTICHEMHQPMQSISGFCQLLMIDFDKHHPKYEYLHLIKEQIDKMGQITNKLLNITSYETLDYIDDIKIIDLDKAAKKKPEGEK